jgi:hypothetical protein
MKNIKESSFCRIFLMLIGIVSFASFAQADYPYFWGNTSGDWSANTTWDMGFPPLPQGHAEHGNYDYALIIGGARITVTVDGNEQGSTDCALGYSTGSSVVTVAKDRHLQINHALDVGIGDSTSTVTGTLNLAESATAFCERLKIGTGGVGCKGIINIENGATFTANSWGGDIIGDAGTGIVNLRGTGSIEFKSGTGLTIGANGHIDIEKGQLKVVGDWRIKLQGYIDNGRITSFGGNFARCVPKVSYQSGVTYVKTAGGCMCETYPVGDMDHDCYIDLSDFMIFTENWLDCTNPCDANCSRVKFKIRDANLKISHDGISLDVSLKCPKFIFNSGLTSENLTPVSIDGDITSGQVVTVSYNRIILNESTSIEAQLLLQWSPEEKNVRKWMRYNFVTTQNNLVLKEIILENINRNLLLNDPIVWVPQSYPAFVNGFYMGIEFPVASTRIEGENLILGHRPGIRPKVGTWCESRKAVYGVAAIGSERKAFENYITLHRPQPTGLHINYCSWWTLPYPAYTQNDTLSLMQKFKDNLNTPYGVSIDTFTIDDGWANKKSMWEINKSTFPNGFTDIKNYAQSMETSLGLWSSPSCYYSNSLDTTWAMEHGFETYLLDYTIPPVRLCCIGGPLYSNAYLNKLVYYANLYGIKQYKIDGYNLNCPESSHGHEPNELSAEAMAQGGINVFQAIHAVSPQAWLEATCFAWNPSPWWLFYVNSVTSPYGDDAPTGRVPCPIYRESYTTARDFYNLQGAALLPIPTNAQEILGLVHQTPEPFLNDGVMTVMRGHGFLPLYIKPTYMNTERWSSLAKLLTWARNNSGTILANTYTLFPESWKDGKTPQLTHNGVMPREIYGYAHSVNNKCLIVLRNPWIQPLTYTLKLNESIGFDLQAAGLSAVSIYPENRVYGQNLHYNSTFTFQIAPYETLVLSIGSGYNLNAIATVGSSIGGKLQTNVTQSSATTNLNVSLQATVDTNAPQTKLLVVMEGTAELKNLTYQQFLINGVSANVQVISSESGWNSTGYAEREHWKILQTDLTSAHSEISLQQLQPDANCTKVSIWAWATKNGNGTPSFSNSLPCPELINLDAVSLGEFKK